MQYSSTGETDRVGEFTGGLFQDYGAQYRDGRQLSLLSPPVVPEEVSLVDLWAEGRL